MSRIRNAHLALRRRACTATPEQIRQTTTLLGRSPEGYRDHVGEVAERLYGNVESSLAAAA